MFAGARGGDLGERRKGLHGSERNNSVKLSIGWGNAAGISPDYRAPVTDDEARSFHRQVRESRLASVAWTP